MVDCARLVYRLSAVDLFYPHPLEPGIVCNSEVYATLNKFNFQDFHIWILSSNNASFCT